MKRVIFELFRNSLNFYSFNKRLSAVCIGVIDITPTNPTISSCAVHPVSIQIVVLCVTDVISVIVLISAPPFNVVVVVVVSPHMIKVVRKQPSL